MNRSFRVISVENEAPQERFDSGHAPGETPSADRFHSPEHLCDQPRRLAWTVGAVALAGLLAFLIDLPVTNALNRQGWFRSIHRTLELAEPFGDFFGVLLVAVGIGVLQPARRYLMPLLVLAVASAGLVADVGKLLVRRIRPNDLHWEQVRTVSDTFAGWFPVTQGGWSHQSFPSAHTATAWALAMILTRLYPRGRWYFPAVAACVGMQRIETGSHYLSDTLIGAAIGISVACLWLRLPLFEGFRSTEMSGVHGSEQDSRKFRSQEFETESSVG